MRTYLYIIAGITSALLGWNLGQFFLSDLGILSNFPEIVLFPCVAVSLASGMVLNEIFISSPTRPKLCLRKAIVPILIALGLGLLSGLIGGIISQIVLLPFIKIPSWIVRTLSWFLIGISVGLAEGLTWRWKSIEAGNRQIFYKRFRTSIIGGSIASLMAALIFELIRQIPDLPEVFRRIEDPVGFAILGIALGLTFSLTGSPSYLVALRAGAGFEYTGRTSNFSRPVLSIEEENLLSAATQPVDGTENTENDDLAAGMIQQVSPSKNLVKAKPEAYPKPRIQNSSLKFIPESDDEDGNVIEEGLSIQLPGKAKLRIGSEPSSDIYIPGIFPYVADLIIENRQAKLKPTIQAIDGMTVNGNKVHSIKEILLKHNYLITFISLDEDGPNEDKFYRFVYYNRFLDPQA